MKKTFLLAFTICLLFINAGYGQDNKPFEGNIRVISYSNFGAVMDSMNAGNKIYDNYYKYKKIVENNKKIATSESMQKSMDIAYAGEESTSYMNGYFEWLIKIKGNKIAERRIKDNVTSVSIYDGDKKEIYICYPTIQGVRKYTFEDFNQLINNPYVKTTVEQIPNDTTILGYMCKKEIITTEIDITKSKTVQQSWYTKNLSLPSFYYDLFGLRGFAMRSENNEFTQGIVINSDVVEIENISLTDDAFTPPVDYKIMNDMEILNELNKPSKERKSKAGYFIGDKIPETFWDF